MPGKKQCNYLVANSLKVSLNPGEKKTVEFKLNHENLALYNRFLELVVEPGVFDVMVGSSSKDIWLNGSFVVKE